MKSACVAALGVVLCMSPAQAQGDPGLGLGPLNTPHRPGLKINGATDTPFGVSIDSRNRTPVEYAERPFTADFKKGVSLARAVVREGDWLIADSEPDDSEPALYERRVRFKVRPKKLKKGGKTKAIPVRGIVYNFPNGTRIEHYKTANPTDLLDLYGWNSKKKNVVFEVRGENLLVVSAPTQIPLDKTRIKAIRDEFWKDSPLWSGENVATPDVLGVAGYRWSERFTTPTSRLTVPGTWEGKGHKTAGGTRAVMSETLTSMVEQIPLPRLFDPNQWEGEAAQPRRAAPQPRGEAARKQARNRRGATGVLGW